MLIGGGIKQKLPFDKQNHFRINMQEKGNHHGFYFMPMNKKKKTLDPSPV